MRELKNIRRKRMTIKLSKQTVRLHYNKNIKLYVRLIA